MATRRTKSRPPPVTPDPQSGGFSKLVLENVRCFVRAEVPLDARVTVIIGQNGSGKTTIAEALASLVDGKGEGLDAFPPGAGRRPEGSNSSGTARSPSRTGGPDRRTGVAYLTRGGSSSMASTGPCARRIGGCRRVRRSSHPTGRTRDRCPMISGTR